MSTSVNRKAPLEFASIKPAASENKASQRSPQRAARLEYEVEDIEVWYPSEPILTTSTEKLVDLEAYENLKSEEFEKLKPSKDTPDLNADKPIRSDALENPAQTAEPTIKRKIAPLEFYSIKTSSTSDTETTALSARTLVRDSDEPPDLLPSTESATDPRIYERYRDYDAETDVNKKMAQLEQEQQRTHVAGAANAFPKWYYDPLAPARVAPARGHSGQPYAGSSPWKKMQSCCDAIARPGEAIALCCALPAVVGGVWASLSGGLPSWILLGVSLGVGLSCRAPSIFGFGKNKTDEATPLRQSGPDRV